MRKIDKKCLSPDVTWTHPFLHEILNLIPKNAESLIDLGCGKGIVGALTRIYRNAKRLVGVDIFPPYLDFCKRFNFYDELYLMDLRRVPLPFQDQEFHVATCIEVIEHLPRKSGEKLLTDLERIAETVIISTPSFYFPNSSFDNNPYRRHLSKWSMHDFKERGYHVTGAGNITVKNLPIPIHNLTRKFPHLFRFLIAKKKEIRNQSIRSHL